MLSSLLTWVGGPPGTPPFPWAIICEGLKGEQGKEMKRVAQNYLRMQNSLHDIAFNSEVNEISKNRKGEKG